MRRLVLLLCFLMPSARAEAPKPLPVSAHNCYPLDGNGNVKLVEALALGIDNVEIDLGWDEPGRRLIVGHDARPRPTATYPTFEDYVRPLLDAPARLDGAPSVLTIDWKTDRPEAVAQFKTFLDSHADLFSTAPKAEPSPLSQRRLTVCFTSDAKAKAAYDALIPPGGTYRAFTDVVHGAGSYLDDPTAYARNAATAYHRFLTFHWAVVEKGAPSLARDWTPAHTFRLQAIVDQAHAQGYRVRFYCLNAQGSLFTINYRFPTQQAARLRWRAAAKAGVDWVASDDYAEIVHSLSNR